MASGIFPIPLPIVVLCSGKCIHSEAYGELHRLYSGSDELEGGGKGVYNGAVIYILSCCPSACSLGVYWENIFLATAPNQIQCISEISFPFATYSF